MSKTITKVIAALGVVAGLGVAALPLSSYAATNPDVIISVTVTATGAGTPDCEVVSGEDVCDVPGTNNEHGQNILFADPDTKNNLANNDDVLDDSGSSATGTRVIETITSPVPMSPGLSAGAGYGVFAAITSGSGYTSTNLGTIAVPRTNWLVVSNSIGTFTSSTPVGDVGIKVTSAIDYPISTEAGTYTNTVTLTTSLNS